MNRLVLYGRNTDRCNERVRSLMELAASVMEKCQGGTLSDPGDWAKDLHTLVNGILEIAEDRGFKGNIWNCLITEFLVNDENPYSTGCEVVGEIQGSINDAALHDISILREYFLGSRKLEEFLKHYRETTDGIDAGNMGQISGLLGIVKDYKCTESNSRTYSEDIRRAICELAVKLDEAEDAVTAKEYLTEFYRSHGVGKFGLHKAFRLEEENGQVSIEPINNIPRVHLDDLVGIEEQKGRLIANTEAFVDGFAANNCLLFGDAGTGKSTCVKALANMYYPRGLRIIEVYRHQFVHLHRIIKDIKLRGYYFIIYMDDLSFEETETDYKYLKAIIEGGLEEKPSNVLIYATSNRRHLVRETWRDKTDYDEELHARDTVQEKLSLSARFGESIYFSSPGKKEYDHIVKELADRYNVDMDEGELLLEAGKWELSHGGLSGRTARQFIDYLIGSRRS